jgi:hypothetical protein
MKKTPRGKPANKKHRPLDPTRLAEVRGGGGLAITVQLATPTSPGLETQHNETLLRR